MSLYAIKKHIVKEAIVMASSAFWLLKLDERDARLSEKKQFIELIEKEIIVLEQRKKELEKESTNRNIFESYNRINEIDFVLGEKNE